MASLSFNPLLHNIRTNLACSFDLDPDTNLRDLFSDDCEYFIEDQFNDMLSSEDSRICDSFSLLHLNIRSLQCNASKLTDLLSNVNLKFSLIGISETWLNDSSSSVDIDGYSFVHKSRENRFGGGVGLYVSSNLNFKFRCDLDFSLPNVAESLFIEIVKPQGKNIVAGVIYRPPNQNVDEFLTMTNELLSKISKENKVCYLMGDFNLNLMNHQSHSVTGEFLDALYSNMFFPLITRPTRITCHSATLIDNIFVNQFFDRSRCGLFFTDISDHLPIFSINFDTSISASNETVFVRDVNQVITTKFLSHLERIDWSQYATFDDPNNAYNSFFKQYSTAYDSCFPLKKTKVSNYRLSKPWLSKGLLKSIRTKNKLYRQYLTNQSSHHETRYKNYKNKLNHSLRIPKRIYYEKKIDASKSNAKATWRVLNEIIKTKKESV